MPQRTSQAVTSTVRHLSTDPRRRAAGQRPRVYMGVLTSRQPGEKPLPTAAVAVVAGGGAASSYVRAAMQSKACLSLQILQVDRLSAPLDQRDHVWVAWRRATAALEAAADDQCVGTVEEPDVARAVVDGKVRRVLGFLYFKNSKSEPAADSVRRHHKLE